MDCKVVCEMEQCTAGLRYFRVPFRWLSPPERVTSPADLNASASVITKMRGAPLGAWKGTRELLKATRCERTHHWPAPISGSILHHWHWGTGNVSLRAEGPSASLSDPLRILRFEC